MASFFAIWIVFSYFEILDRCSDNKDKYLNVWKNGG